MAAWFDPLLALLSAQPRDTTTVTLTLAEVMALASRPPPASVVTHHYWLNRSRPPSRQLVAVGWHMVHLNRAAGTLTFARVGAPA